MSVAFFYCLDGKFVSNLHVLVKAAQEENSYGKGY